MKVRWAACFSCLLIGITITEAQKFLSQQYASEFLLRKRRANTLFEETKNGNLERECIEELCNKEEAREIFENNPETEYFYPKYLACLGSYRAGISRLSSLNSHEPVDLRSCVTVITDQCKPLPCHMDGYQECKDGEASYTCICKPGWEGEKCEEDINECEDPDSLNGGCSQKCVNFAGSHRCLCEDGYYLSSDKQSCKAAVKTLLPRNHTTVSEDPKVLFPPDDLPPKHLSTKYQMPHYQNLPTKQYVAAKILLSDKAKLPSPTYHPSAEQYQVWGGDEQHTSIPTQRVCTETVKLDWGESTNPRN